MDIFLEESISSLKKLREQGQFTIFGKPLKDGLYPIHIITEKGSYTCLEFILNLGINPNIPEKNGNTPVHISIINNHINCLDLLIASGAELNIFNNEGINPLMLSIILNKTDIFKRIFSRIPGDNDYLDKHEYSLAHHAAKNGNLEILDLLYRRGISLNKFNKYGETPLHLAANGHFECLKFIFSKYGFHEDYFEHPIFYSTSNHFCLKFFIDNEVKPNITNNKGNNLCHAASGNGNLICLRGLVEIWGVNPYLINSYKESPVHIAVKCNKPEILKYLIDRESFLEESDCIGYYPIHIAAAKNHPKCLEVLIDSGVSLMKEVSDGSGNTACHIAILHEAKESLNLLKEKGANFEIENKSGKTALNLARQLKINFNVISKNL